MESLTLQPIARVEGTVNLPGSKSVSNRALLLAALARGTTVLTNLLDSDDVRHMLNALSALGVQYTLSADRTRCEVTGNGGPLRAAAALELFLGNAGTAMRPLAAALCLGSNDIVLTGEPRMKERPIGHLVDALRQGGAQIDYLEQENYPPLRLRGGFQGGNVEVDGSVSSQFLTALLMTAPLAPQDTVIAIKGDLVSKPYIDITLHLMKTFGVEVDNQSYQRFVVRGKQQYQSPGDYLVEGDASSASYFLAAGAIKGGTVKVTGIGRGSGAGRYPFRRRPGENGRYRDLGRRFYRLHPRRAQGYRYGYEPYPGRGDDHRHRRAVRARDHYAAQYLQLAGQRDGPSVRHGDRVA
ncbi:3-phosphoshikimate 1-carboxyvinyltransferase [Klebsiella variicola]|nr:3-phosphoshikimate 1-carboxyvinyltransferase [Klebsiella variicola]